MSCCLSGRTPADKRGGDVMPAGRPSFGDSPSSPGTPGNQITKDDGNDKGSPAKSSFGLSFVTDAAKGLTSVVKEAASTPVKLVAKPTKVEPPPDAEPACGKLVIQVLEADGLSVSHALQGTMDAFLELSLNHDKEPFAKTTVKYKSKGCPKWNEAFEVGLPHPASRLRINFRDENSGMESLTLGLADKVLQLSCGHLEIPLAELKRDKAVCGWFTVSQPKLLDLGIAPDEAAEGNKNSAETSEVQAPADNAASSPKEAPADEHVHRGRVKLELLWTSTLMNEVKGFMRPAPVFEDPPPPLNMKVMARNLLELKNMVWGDMLQKVVNVVLLVLSWQNPTLSGGVLAGHWFLWSKPRFAWAYLFFLLLLCFWRPKRAKAQKKHEASTKEKLKNVGKNASEGLKRMGTGIQSFGIGVKDEAVHITKKPNEMPTLVPMLSPDSMKLSKPKVEVTDETIEKLAGDASKLLILYPSGQKLLRKLQSPVQMAHDYVEIADDALYWVNETVAKIAVGALAGAMAVATLFPETFRWLMGHLLWFVWLIGGTFGILFKTPVVSAMFATKNALMKPKDPWVKSKGPGFFKTA